MKRFFLALIGMGLLAGCVGHGGHPGYRGFDSWDPETPLIAQPWARPLPDGPLRTAIIAPRFSLLDVATLAEVIELDVSVVPMWLRDEWDCPANWQDRLGAAAPATTRRLLDAVTKKTELMVLGNVDLAALPPDAVDVVTDQVRSGAGLVITRFYGGGFPPLERYFPAIRLTETPAELTHGTAAAFTPQWSAGVDFVRTYALGEGRVVELRYTGQPPATQFVLPAPTDPFADDEVFRQSYLSLVARVMRWAAGRGGQGLIENITPAGAAAPDPRELPPDMPVAHMEYLFEIGIDEEVKPMEISLAHPANKGWRLRGRVRTPGRTAFPTFTTDIPHGARSAQLFLPVPTGRHIVDCWVLDTHGRVVDWHSRGVEMEGWPAFSGLRFSKTSLLPHDSLQVFVDVTRRSFEPRACTALVRATDNFGRRVAEASALVPPTGGSTAVHLGVADQLGRRLKIEVWVVDNRGRPVTEQQLIVSPYAFAYLPVRKALDEEAFLLSTEGLASPEYNGRRYASRLQHLGVDAFFSMGGETAAFLLSGSGLAPVIEQARYHPQTARPGGVREPCMSDPEYQRFEMQRLAQALLKTRPFSPGAHSLGRNNCLSSQNEDLCASPSCTARFRHWLKTRYSSLAALNTAWDRQYSRWEEIDPATITRGMGQAWLDWRIGMDDVFHRFHLLARDTVRHADPGARVGFRPLPATTVYSGYDWTDLARDLDLLVVPNEPWSVAQVAGNQPPGAMNLLWHDSGDTLSPQRARWYPWYAALQGLGGVAWPQAYATTDDISPAVPLNPAGAPLPLFAAVLEQKQRLDAGLAALLRRSEPVNTVAVLDDPEMCYRPGGRQMAGDLLAYLNATGRAARLVRGNTTGDSVLGEYSFLLFPPQAEWPKGAGRHIARFEDDGGSVIKLPEEASDWAGLLETVPRVMDFQYRKDRPFPGIMRRFHYGAADILAILRNPEETGATRERVKVHLEETAFLYDMLAGESPSTVTGADGRRGRKVTARLKSGEAVLIAAMPYSVDGLALTVPDQIIAGERLNVEIAIEADYADILDHMVHVTFARRFAASALRHYDQVVLCPGGEGKAFIPLALNDRPGEYVVTARDVLTGATASANVEVIGVP